MTAVLSWILYGMTLALLAWIVLGGAYREDFDEAPGGWARYFGAALRPIATAMEQARTDLNARLDRLTVVMMGYDPDDPRRTLEQRKREEERAAKGQDAPETRPKAQNIEDDPNVIVPDIRAPIIV